MIFKDKLRTFYYNNTQSTVPVLLDEDLDICAILSGFHKSHLIDINNEAKNNVADGCPFKVGSFSLFKDTNCSRFLIFLKF